MKNFKVEILVMILLVEHSRETLGLWYFSRSGYPQGCNHPQYISIALVLVNAWSAPHGPILYRKLRGIDNHGINNHVSHLTVTLHVF